MFLGREATVDRTGTAVRGEARCPAGTTATGGGYETSVRNPVSGIETRVAVPVSINEPSPLAQLWEVAAEFPAPAPAGHVNRLRITVRCAGSG